MRDNCLSGPKYCPKCGEELDTYEKRCKFCKTNLKQFTNNNERKKD
jgi:hypothetical protein